jgi:hypothetical protein
MMDADGAGAWSDCHDLPGMIFPIRRVLACGGEDAVGIEMVERSQAVTEAAASGVLKTG